MRRFVALHAALEAIASTPAKAQALERYFREAPPLDAAWAAFFLTGRTRLTRADSPSVTAGRRGTVTSATEKPARASPRAATQPAGPPPATRMSVRSCVMPLA